MNILPNNERKIARISALWVKSLQFFVRFLGEVLSSYIHSENNWPLASRFLIFWHWNISKIRCLKNRFVIDETHTDMPKLKIIQLNPLLQIFFRYEKYTSLTYSLTPRSCQYLTSILATSILVNWVGIIAFARLDSNPITNIPSGSKNSN